MIPYPRCGTNLSPLAGGAEAGGDVVVDHARGLHERVGGGGSDEDEAPPLELLGHRRGLGGGGRGVGHRGRGGPRRGGGEGPQQRRQAPQAQRTRSSVGTGSTARTLAPSTDTRASPA